MMVESWNAVGDFEEVVDTLETVTLIHCEATDHREQAEAWRFEETVYDSPLAPGTLTQVVTTWQVGAVEGGRPPRPGERLCDSDSRVATIRSVRRLRGGTRWACEAARYAVLPEAEESFDIERPVVTSSPGGATIGSWSLQQTGVRGCFVPREKDPLETISPWDIVLIDSKEVSVGARIHRRRGGVYAVSAVVPPAGIGEPWLVTAEEIE